MGFRFCQIISKVVKSNQPEGVHTLMNPFDPPGFQPT